MNSDAAICTRIVALRKESVDRNAHQQIKNGYRTMSLSARRAWIEITVDIEVIGGESVALRKESVDRNG